MCASPLRGAAVADATAEYQLRLSAFCFRFFFRSFLRHPCRSHACTALPPAFGRVGSAWTTGSSPVVTSQRQWPPIARARRRVARTRIFSPRHQALRRVGGRERFSPAVEGYAAESDWLIGS